MQDLTEIIVTQYNLFFELQSLFQKKVLFINWLLILKLKSKKYTL